MKFSAPKRPGEFVYCYSFDGQYFSSLFPFNFILTLHSEAKTVNSATSIPPLLVYILFLGFYPILTILYPQC